MTVIEMNPGEKIPYEISGTIISLNGGEVAIDIADRQKDVAVYIDIFWTSAGELQEGSGEAYAANIVIPPWVQKEEDSGEVDDDGKSIFQVVREPLNMDEVILKLWAIPEHHKNKEE